VALAKETVAIARETGSPTFEKVAKWTLIVSAATSTIVAIAHTFRAIARDLTKNTNDHAHAAVRQKPVSPPHAPAEPSVRDHAQRDERSWVEKSRANDRAKQPWQKQHAYRDGHGFGGRH